MAKEKKGVMENLRGFIDDFYFKNAMDKIGGFKSTEIPGFEKDESMKLSLPLGFEELKNDALERLNTVHESGMPLGEKRAEYKKIVDWYENSVNDEMARVDDFLKKKGPAFVRR